MVFLKTILKAVNYLTKAADQGNVNAQATLGELYAKGLGSPKDYTKAREYLKKAANQGDTESKELLKRIAQIKLFQYGDYDNSKIKYSVYIYNRVTLYFKITIILSKV